MNKDINIAILGIGNCCASLVMGLSYYQNAIDESIPGLMHTVLGRYKISDIRIVAAFDVDRRKIGKDIIDAILSEPNCTKQFESTDNMKLGTNRVTVMKGPVLDGVASHMNDYFQVDKDQKELTKDEILTVLKETQTQIIVSYLPVGSQLATEFWAQIALDANIGFVNCIPVFIASDPIWADKFRQANIPIIGDDAKSQCGSTIVNRYLVQMIQDRGGKIVNSWQTNFGGNTDFLNMTSENRLKSKKISKTQSISSLLTDNNNYIYAGPNGFIECLSDNKISYMRIDFKIFGDIDCHLDIKLDVEDSPNSSGVMIDAIRIAKIALDKGIGGPLIGPSSWLMKHPIEKYSDNIARNMTEDFIKENTRTTAT